MATKEVDVKFNFDTKNSTDGANKAVANLKRIQDQANKTRESMAKMTEIGAKMAMVGAGILAPLTLAMNKYVSTMKDTEPASKRITELSKQWEASQIRLGRVTAEIVLPALEKGAAILEKVIAFAEANPGVVKAALTIGTTLVVLGGLIATTAQLVSVVATIQGLAASAGIALGGGGAAAGGVAAGGGLAAAVAAGMTLAIPALVSALAVVIGGQIGLGIGNALAGTNQTWGDIWNTLKGILELNRIFFFQWVPKWFQSLGTAIGNAMKSIGAFIASLFRGGKASGGYMSSPGLYAGAEGGREFVLNNQTTRNAERAIGGRLSQQNAAAMLTQNFQVGNGMTISQTRRMIRANETAIMGTLSGAFS